MSPGEPIRTMYLRQIMSWPTAAENYHNLRNARLNGARTTIHSNPYWTIEKLYVEHRRDSITAKTDAVSIARRMCFLCKENRPDCQISFPWHGFEILVNPYPLSTFHLTIASLLHAPQSIANHITDMAALSRLLFDDCVFYNGPRCGASAPDHLHFQAVQANEFHNLRRDIPKELILTNASDGDRDGAATLYASTASPYPFFIIEVKYATVDNGDKALKPIFGKVMEALSSLHPDSDEEPPVNIAVTYDGINLTNTFFIIPRRKHRPDCYGSGEHQMLISPATIEILGTIVCSRREDFEALDGDKALAILREVALSPDDFQIAVNRILAEN